MPQDWFNANAPKPQAAQPPSSDWFAQQAPKAAPGRDWIDTLTDWLPTIGGTVGGVAGAAGGPLGSVGGAALGGMAGDAYRQLINRARGRQAPQTPVAAARETAIEGAIQGGAQVVGAAIAPAARAVGARVMQSAVKPGLKFLTKGDPAATPQVVKTLLDEGVNVTPGGLTKLQRLVSSTNDEIKTALAPHAKKEIPAFRVASRLTPQMRDAMNQVNAPADLEAISQVGENFLANPNISARGTLTLGQAQAMKQGTYRRIGDKYGKVSTDAIQAEKALARGLKDDIASEVPSITALNAREGRLLESLDAVGRRVALAGNRDPVGFAWVAHNPTTFLAALIDRSPAVKSLLARGLYNHAGQIAHVPPALIRVAVHSLATGDPQVGSAVTSIDPGRR